MDENEFSTLRMWGPRKDKPFFVTSQRNLAVEAALGHPERVLKYEIPKAEAKEILNEYINLVSNIYRTEVTMTMPIANNVSSEISYQYQKIMQGINNAEEYEKTQYYDSTRSSD